MKALRALLAGILGAIAMSATMFLIRQLGEDVSLEVLLGSLFGNSIALPQWLTGFILHVVIGAVVGLLYAIVFEIVESSGPLTGRRLRSGSRINGRPLYERNKRDESAVPRDQCSWPVPDAHEAWSRHFPPGALHLRRDGRPCVRTSSS